MKEDYLMNWNMMTNEVHKKLQTMMELNIKTLQELSYLKFEDLSTQRQPGDMLVKHMALTMENSQKIFDYMQKSFQILGTAVGSFSKEMKENTEQSTQASSVPIRKKQKSSEAKKTLKTLAESQPVNAKVKKAVSKDKTTKVSNKTKLSETKATKSADSIKTSVRKTMKSDKKVKITAAKMDKPVAKKNKTKDKMTLLEQKMGLPEPKPSLLVDREVRERKPEMSDPKMQFPEHSLGGHPLSDQTGRGKNPFRK